MSKPPMMTDAILAKRDKDAFDGGFAAGLECNQERIAAADAMAKALEDLIAACNRRSYNLPWTAATAALAAYNALK